MSVPALRFKQDDGSEFPIWIGKKIGDFVLSHKGGAPLKPADFVKIGNFEVIPKKAISKAGYLKLDETEPTFCSERFFEANQRSVVDNTYLITTLRDLVPSGPSIGYIVKYNNNKKYILAQGVYGIQIDEKLIDDFLIQYSNTDKYRELMQTMMVGSTQVHIRNSDFFNTPFSVPSLKEQIKIANFLTAVDEKITQITQKYDLLTQYKKGVMQQVFSQKLRFKDDDGGDFPEWQEKALGEVGEIVTGKTPSTTDESLWDGDIQFVTPTDICEGKYQTNTARTVVEHIKLKVLPEGSIMFTCIASIGKMSLSTKPCITNQQINSLIPKSIYNNEYLYYALLSITEFIKSTQSSSTLPIINKTEFSKFIIPIPSKVEQTKIANFLSSIDDKITSTQYQLQAVKQYKQGLLQQMFV
jgi:type I restriction enzyme S subunit